MHVAIRLLAWLIHRFTSKDYDSLISLKKQLLYQVGFGIGGSESSISHEAEIFAGILKQLNITQPIILDIGANVGKFSKQIVEKLPNSQVFAFEPSSYAYQELLRASSSIPQITTVNVAFGDKEEFRDMYSDRPGSSLTSFSKRNLNHLDIEFNEIEKVKVIQLSTWVVENGILPDAIKIDVEGDELKVIKGALDIIDKVVLIQFEFGGCNIDSRTFFRDFFELFLELQFDIYRLAKPKPIRISKYIEDEECFLTANYLALNRRFISVL